MANGLNGRIKKLEASVPSEPEANCGRGLTLQPGTPAKCCHWHGYNCWHRPDPRVWAQAAMILEAIEAGDPNAEVGEPPPELVAEARELLLSKGYQLHEE